VIYVFDIDNTVCKTEGSDYKNSKPIRERINKINELYDQGHKIVFHTARGMGRTNNDAARSHYLFYKMTFEQLNNWGVKFHNLYLGKPSGDIYVDDKGIRDVRFFE
jgi:capsule biosynthesis phosphatase